MIDEATVRAPLRASLARPGLAETGLLLLVVAGSVVFTPLSITPFVDVKIFFAAFGALLVWLARPRLDRRVAVLVGVWLSIATLALAFGIDPRAGVLGVEARGVGLVALLASGVFLLGGLALGDELAERVAGWMVAAGVAVASFAVVVEFWGDSLSDRLFKLDLTGSTFGQVVYTAPFCSAAIVALLARRRSWRVEVPLLLVLGSGLSVSTNRSGWLGLIIGLAVVGWRARPDRRRLLLLAGVLVVVFAGWTAADLVEGGESRFSAAGRFDDGGTLRQRVHIWSAGLDMWRERPLLGWGPAGTPGAYMSVVTAEDYRTARRAIDDTHNLLVESAVTTGALGLGALVVLGATVGRRVLRGVPPNGWAAGTGAVLLVSHLTQPLHPSITPLLFLLVGIAARAAPGDGPVEDGPGERSRTSAPGTRSRASVGLVAIVALALTASTFLAGRRTLAGLFEGHGRYYDSGASIRTALRIEPNRLLATEALGYHYAVRWRSAFQEPELQARLGARTRALGRELVAEHGWDPGVRLVAANYELIMDNPAGADRWFKEQLDRFPVDTLALQGRAQVALLARDYERARVFAALALRIQPQSRAAKRFLGEAEAGLAAASAPASGESGAPSERP